MEAARPNSSPSISAGAGPFPDEFNVGAAGAAADVANRIGAQTEPPPTSADRSANAIQHGLAAKKHLPRVLRPGRLREIIAALRADYFPRDFSQELLLIEVARHAAALEVTQEAEPAVQRVAALALTSLSTPENPADFADSLLAAAVTAEPLDRVARYRRGHEKALHHALEKLRLSRATVDAGTCERPLASPPMFSTTADCESYLRARFSSPRWRCPRCRESDGHWLQVRKRWECARCRAQIGLRHGTVFEHSPLPLTIWFRAIRTFAGDTAISACALMAPTGIRRRATAQTVLRRIRGTLDGNTFDQALAGLMAFPLPAVNEHSTHKKAKRNCDLPAQQANRNH